MQIHLIIRSCNPVRFFKIFNVTFTCLVSEDDARLIKMMMWMIIIKFILHLETYPLVISVGRLFRQRYGHSYAKHDRFVSCAVLFFYHDCYSIDWIIIKIIQFLSLWFFDLKPTNFWHIAFFHTHRYTQVRSRSKRKIHF